MKNQTTLIDEVLHIDDVDKQDEINRDEAVEEPKITKYTAATSPWSRIIFIAVPCGLGFMVIFLVLTGIINSASKTITKKVESKKIANTTLDEIPQKDGDAYAKLALGKQESELEKLQSKNKAKSNKQPKKDKTSKILRPVKQSSKPIVVKYYPKPVTRVARYQAPLPQPQIRAIPRSYLARTIPQTVKPEDPIQEMSRLRDIGSFGVIAYTETSNPDSTEQALNNRNLNTINSATNNSYYPSTNASINRFNQAIGNSPNGAQFPPNTSPSPSTIEKITPRWQPSENPVINQSNNLQNTQSSSYSPEETQIINGNSPHYLVVGESASGVLVTSVIKQDGNNFLTVGDTKRFVAKLTQDLHDNTGAVAMPSGTLLAVQALSTTGSYAQLQVTSIIQNATEYPISPGAITVEGDRGNPLIAHKFKDKGGEIAAYDITQGLVSGLAQIGTIINQPTTTASIITSTGTSSTSATSSNSQNNIGAAFLQGAFGKLSTNIGQRAQVSTQEILARPDIWIINKGTKITFEVNRTLELPAP